MKRYHPAVSPAIRFLLLVAAIVAIGFIMSACAAPAGGEPRTFNDYAGQVVMSADQVVTSTRTLLRAGKITPDDAESVLQAAELARDGVAVARGVAVKEGAAAGVSRLRLAADALDQLSAYVATKGAP